MKVKRCNVVNDKDEIIYRGALAQEIVSKNIECNDSSFVVIKIEYPREVAKVVPLENTYFFYTEE